MKISQLLLSALTAHIGISAIKAAANPGTANFQDTFGFYLRGGGLTVNNVEEEVV